MVWVILAIVVAVVVVYIVLIYNSLVWKKNKVQNAWSQIEVQLKRRFDLIPNIVETVKGYAEHERATLEKVTEARTRFMSGMSQKEAMNASGEVGQLLGRLFAVAESYPELKANENFIELQDELTRTEDKITFSRQFYNDVVMDLNNSIQMFPSNLIAAIFGFKQELFMHVDEMEKENINVKFE